ncbi:MAG TPA: hypothetical protein VFA20_00805 [Myxococcaceae bacterium]|nr:hypothetical protein [Myxococcaceae bacterium]
MNAAQILTVALLVALTTTAAHAADAAPSVADAKKRLQQASENLARAVQKIEKDPPATPDLDAAWAAVSTLKDAIDAGAAVEGADLDYAKAALAARKQLRTQRDYVEGRRAKVYLFNHRRTIDAALAAMNDRVARTERKDASPKDFEDARAALADLRKAIEPARQFSKEDAAFAKYLSDTDAAATKADKTIEDRWTLRAVDAHRAKVESSRQMLSAAMAALTKNGSDAQFSAADQAANNLSKLLDEGKTFEPRDKAYAGVADGAHAEIADARKRMEQLLSTTALERLKSEIEPAYQDLTATLKSLRGRKPTDEQLAEAKTATIVVRKLVEKYQPQAARSKPFAEYLNQVTATLAEVDGELLRRDITGAKGDVVKALRNIERRDATDDQFAELNTALTVMEKTLEPFAKRVPSSVAAEVADARQLVRDARTTITRRRYEVDLTRMRTKVQDTKRNTEAVVAKIQAAGIGEKELADAEESLKQLKAVLDEGAPFIRKDHDYSEYDKSVKQRITELTDRIARRRIAINAGGARAKLTELMADGKSKLEAANRPESAEADLDAASRSVDALTKALEGFAPLEKQDAGYAASAERARNELVRQMEGLELAKQAGGARRQTATPLAAGEQAARAAGEAKDLRTQKKHYDAAMTQFRSCESSGAQLLKENPALEKVIALVEGRSMAIKDVVAQCTERAKAIEQPLRQASSMVAFEDGPKKAFENAKMLIARNARNEAIPKLEECIVAASQVQSDFRELKEHKFDVGGTSLTLSEMIKTCAAQRDALVQKR